mgnify:CR=1 FL=1|tara:strand:+ start:32859 stop:36596 length:3738 start_codon:yes stop_codon:yes gene_type:complete
MSSEDASNTQDEELLADLFDSLLQEILEGRTPDIDAVHPNRPDLRERIAKTWSLACSVAGRREPSRPVFGGYEIVRELGHGGMGTVYLARHQTLQRDVAVKVLPQSLAMSPRAKQRFVEEARSLAQLRHDNVVHLHRIVDHSEMLAFEMEYIDGPSLQKLIAELRQTARPHDIDSLAKVLGMTPEALGTHSTVEWFVRVMIKISRALGEVHRLGLVHRDVKPANILLRKDGTPVLADFGLALPSDLDPQSVKFAGTPVYAAPERLRGDTIDVHASADIYSLGITLHELLTLSPPYQGSTTHEVLRRIESGSLVALRKQAPHISRDLATIVSKAMEADARHRYASADDLADDLERLLNLQPIQAQPAGPVRRATKFVRRHQKAFLAATCGALLVALIAWPLAALAAETAAKQQTATAARHQARTQLLCQESLPPWWGSSERNGRIAQQESTFAPQRRSLELALTHYQRALQATPDDDALQREVAAVRAAARSLTTQALTTQASTTQKPTDTAFATTDPFAAGLYSFLTGNRVHHRSMWQTLPAEFGSDPFLDACMALGLATEGKAAQAYARVFHAARAFPNATALVIAMADGALRSGDLATARRWFDAIPTDVPVLDTPRQLLAADLMVADGDRESAQKRYRQLSRRDPSDPRPLLRLVDLSLRIHDLDGARRICQSMLKRWPSLHRARKHLAQLALQRHDVSGYLAYVQGAMRRGDRDAAELDELLHLGGLQRLHAESNRTIAPDAATVPLNSFLRPDQLRGIEMVLDVLPTLQAIRAKAGHIDARQVGAAIVGLGLGAARFPDVASNLPLPVQGMLAVLISFREAPTEYLTNKLLPYQTALGARFHTVRPNHLFSRDTHDQNVFYGSQVLQVEDLDGDTLPDICVAAPPSSGSSDPGYMELRRSDDGTLLSRWDDPGADGLFARSIADLGDVDGDFCNDILIGKPIGSLTTVSFAAVEVRSGRTGERLWQVTDPYGSFGACVCALSDVNGDGIRDVAVGSPPLRLDDPGKAWVLSGADGSVISELAPPSPGTWFGGCVATAGDLTGDGIDEVLVGGNYGNSPGLVAAFNGVTGERVMTVTDEDPDSMFGFTLAAVGDIDGDNRNDFAIGAPGPSGNSVAIISGRTGNSIYELHGERPGEQFGTTLCVMPAWRADARPAIAVSSRRGGPSGGGYVRVFDLQSSNPLQTFATSQGVLGFSLVDLGDRDGDDLRDLGMMIRSGGQHCILWAMSYADIAPRSPSDEKR